MQVLPQVAVPRHQLEHPGIHLLVPHPGFQVLQGWSKFQICPPPHPFPLRLIFGSHRLPLSSPHPPRPLPCQSLGIPPRHLHLHSDTLLHRRLGQLICLLVPGMSLVRWDVHKRDTFPGLVHHLCDQGGHARSSLHGRQHRQSVRRHDPLSSLPALVLLHLFQALSHANCLCLVVRAEVRQLEFSAGLHHPVLVHGHKCRANPLPRDLGAIRKNDPCLRIQPCEPILCPSLPGSQRYVQHLSVRWIRELKIMQAALILHIPQHDPRVLQHPLHIGKAFAPFAVPLKGLLVAPKGPMAVLQYHCRFTPTCELERRVFTRSYGPAELGHSWATVTEAPRLVLS
mmetsp:Transcript_13048/g.21464  ORF Transcript_13048/g.21464 Transcript_13048/m.21464 type:complete len:341 (-) Transcript_13048:45-1067(-)